MRDLITDVLESSSNGWSVLVSWASAPVSLSLLIAAVSLWWLGMVESEHLTRHSAKPDIGHH